MIHQVTASISDFAFYRITLVLVVLSLVVNKNTTQSFVVGKRTSQQVSLLFSVPFCFSVLCVMPYYVLLYYLGNCEYRFCLVIVLAVLRLHRSDARTLAN